MGKFSDVIKGIVMYKGGTMGKFLNKPGAAVVNAADQRPVYRYPAPASQDRPIVPSGPTDRTYDIKYFPRDLRRSEWKEMEMPIEASFKNQQLLAKPDMKENAQRPSPGNRNPDVMRYDPSGLRTTMTANILTPVWAYEADKVIEFCEKNNLPAQPGMVTPTDNKNPRKFVHRW